MRPNEEQKALRDVDSAIRALETIRKRLLDVFAVDDQPSGRDSWDDTDGPRDSVHEQAVRVVASVKRLAQMARATSVDALNLTSHVKGKK